jgi:hypothetical protein
MWTLSLLRCGLAAGPVFVAVFLAEGAVREGYNPLRHPVSSLALGPRGWIQAGNFAVARLVRLGGLFQRASIITGFAWLTVLSARTLRHQRVGRRQPRESRRDVTSCRS